jgi:hypothetical protein
VQQTYYSNRESSNYDTAYASSSINRAPVDLSPVALNVRVSPSTRIDANSRIEYDVSGLGLAVWAVGSTLSAGQSSGTLSYSRRHFARSSKPETYFSGSSSLRSPNGHFTGTYALSWDITHSTIVMQNVLATYMAQCCGVQVDFQKFNFPQSTPGFPIPSDRRINFSFVLAGLGTFSNFFGAFGNSAR